MGLTYPECLWPGLTEYIADATSLSQLHDSAYEAAQVVNLTRVARERVAVELEVGQCGPAHLHQERRDLHRMGEGRKKSNHCYWFDMGRTFATAFHPRLSQPMSARK